jgi:P-type Cu2+ transporter
MAAKRSTVVLEVSGVHWAASKSVAEAVLSRRPGVIDVAANPVAQIATVSYDPSQTSVAELAGWVRDCGYHCAGQSVPDHICDPLAEPAAARDKHDHPQTTGDTHTEHHPGARPWPQRSCLRA